MRLGLNCVTEGEEDEEGNFLDDNKLNLLTIVN